MLHMSLAAILIFPACTDLGVVEAGLEPVAAAQMDIISGNAQTGLIGEQLPDPLVARVTDVDGNPVEGHIVNFRVTEGGGSVFAGAGLTNADGIAQEYLTLGSAPGLNRVEARAVNGGTGEKLVFATFDATGVSEMPIAALAVAPASRSLQVGQTVQLRATALDPDSNAVERLFTWSSSDTSVAAVNESGRVTARAAGTATIEVAAENKREFARISVARSAAADTARLAHPRTPTVTATYVDADSFSVTASWSKVNGAASYHWETGANSGGWRLSGNVATNRLSRRVPRLEAANGYWLCVRSVDPAGNRSSEAACNGYSIPRKNSSNPGTEPQPEPQPAPRPEPEPQPGPEPEAEDPTVATVVLSPSSHELQVGQAVQLRASAADAAGNSLERTFTWSSSNSRVATVNSSGRVTARAAGSVRISALADGVSGSADIIVSSPSSRPVQPALEEDFSSYSSTAHMLSDPRGIYSRTEDIEIGHIELDTRKGVSGSGKSMKYTFPTGTREFTISRSLDISRVLGEQTELWVEVVVEFDEFFTLSNPNSSAGEAYKFLHLNGPGSPGRFGLNFENGDRGALNAEGPNDAYSALYVRGDRAQTSMAAMRDGNDHTVRYHVRLGTTSFHEFWVDGRYQGSSTGSTSERLLTDVALGKNINQLPPNRAQSVWWKRVRVYTEDPGW